MLNNLLALLATDRMMDTGDHIKMKQSLNPLFYQGKLEKSRQPTNKGTAYGT